MKILTLPRRSRMHCRACAGGGQWDPDRMAMATADRTA